jgi:GNAT superfamily N-acetyltransferase
MPPESNIAYRPASEAELDVARNIDDDACLAYADAGLAFHLDEHAAFVAAELAAWSEAAHAGRMIFACAGTPGGDPIGFSAVGHVDGHPHLHQLSVRRAWMRRGIGRTLVKRACEWSEREGELWLTTYGHLSWNGPWYERLGFATISESECGPALRAILAAERKALPGPEHRIAMRYRHRNAAGNQPR